MIQVRMSFTPDESFILVRALERSIGVMEANQKDSMEPKFWGDLIALDEKLLKKVEQFRNRCYSHQKGG